jgi:hypothetical protein
MTLTDNRGRQIPFFIQNFTYEDIRTANFDPITTLHDAKHVHPTELNISEVGSYQKGGFLVRPDTDGVIYGIPWRDYVNNRKSLTGLTPQSFLGLASTWIECPMVKVYAKNDGTYPATSSYINVALI